MDPRGIKGSWESLVFYVNQEKTEGIRKLAADAQWFEDRMPWAPEYRKQGVRGITANAIDVVIETGDSGPITPIGINLPNDQNVREQHGSKSVSLSNVNEAYDRSTPPEFRREFSWTPEEAGAGREVEQRAVRAADQHARGDRPRLRQDRGSAQGQSVQPALKEQYSALEEAPRRSRRALLPAESQARRARASSPPPIRPRSSRPSTRATRATRWCSSAACAKGRRSKKTTCATGRWSCAG